MTIKYCKIFNKKAVSPLIATVLLISFAVALGAVVLNWGRSLDLSEPGDQCSSVSIKIRVIENTEVCYTSSGQKGYFKFVLDNKGDIDIDGLSIWITGDNKNKLINFDELFIRSGELLDIKDNSVEIPEFNTYGTLKDIQFIPKIKVDGSLNVCAKNSVKANKIEVCQ